LGEFEFFWHINFFNPPTFTNILFRSLFFLKIKGSNPEMDYLSREDYRDLNTRKYPAFSHNRDQIYDLFQQYEKMKARNGDYDSMDR